METFLKIKKVFIANRGEIACRIIRCCKENGLHTISIFSKEDADAKHVIEADESHLLSGIGAQAYIDIDEIVKIAVESKADVVVPGYGFLSENSNFADELSKVGILFVGPSTVSIETFGLKHSARKLAEENDVPTVPGSDLIKDFDEALFEANKIGFPIMLKSTAGGGGMGLKVCHDSQELRSSLLEVISRGETLFKNSGVFLEKYIQNGRHIEIQIFGNGKGEAIAIGERECSIQRRHQKVIEEAPSPFVNSFKDLSLRRKLSVCAIKLASSVHYKSAGTIEFLIDDDTGSFYFLEMNTRLQVEHGITELIYNVDLMKLMLLQADYELRNEVGLSFEKLNLDFESSAGILTPSGWAIECRVYAENPVKNFQPSPGILHYVEFPKSVHGCKLRIDHWIETGTKVSPYFDPLLAKVMVWGKTREEARLGMIQCLLNTKIQGPPVNIDYLRSVLESHEFSVGRTLTSFLGSTFNYEPPLIEFINGGSYTTIQDLPGREKCSAGIPLSGPSDSLNFQLANIIVGNERHAEAIEIIHKGPTIKFHSSAVVCLTGGEFSFKVKGKKLPMYTAISIPKGSVIKIGGFNGEGAKCYLAIKGGFPDVAYYLGSKSCTPTLNLGGHQGRVVMTGDCLSIEKNVFIDELQITFELPSIARPNLDRLTDDFWTIKMLKGPHDSPDICSEEGIHNFYNNFKYKVNLNSNRGSVKLDGPSEVFSRKDGGDGGSHPSNILEYPYPSCGLSVVGSVINLFGVDGSTLSGFVCISVPVLSEWWKFGQAKVGANIQFKLISYDDALKLNKLRESFLNQVEVAIKSNNFKEIPKFVDELDSYEEVATSSILYQREKNGEIPSFAIRQAGERMVLMDFGIEHFNLLKSGRQKLLQDRINKQLEGIVVRIEANTGSLGLIFDITKIDRKSLVDKLIHLEGDIPPPHDLKVKSKLFALPCCFDHSAIQHCIDRYTHSQRPYAPYLPSNTEYVMKANCLKSMEEFKACVIGQTQVITAVSFLCANTLTVNLDPRTRFKTGKFNPARTFTPKGALGSGSVGNSIYSIDSPGGYMIWGMALPDICWNTFSRLAISDEPWFFNNFDQIVYYEVTEAELNELNNQLLTGKFELDVKEVEFDFGKYAEFLDEIHDDLETLNKKKDAAVAKLMEEEDESMSKWLTETAKMKPSKSSGSSNDDLLNDPSILKVTCTMAANVFKINYSTGSKVSVHDNLLVLEAMKMEIYIKAINDDERSFEVVDIVVSEGDVVNPGDVLLFLKAI
ncbi:allophanate hydrolase subunit 2-domain-containing protein [Scheffersomyces coipomensis]|uniref:allophanate hydrolase subunit 2-domain-containing protein n=1 Tax=Scheffersomyces coipomensis TaxID=1788519 RepID=UPI00315D92A3